MGDRDSRGKGTDRFNNSQATTGTLGVDCTRKNSCSCSTGSWADEDEANTSEDSLDRPILGSGENDTPSLKDCPKECLFFKQTSMPLFRPRILTSGPRILSSPVLSP